MTVMTLEAVLRRERTIIAVALGAVAFLAWSYIIMLLWQANHAPALVVDHEIGDVDVPHLAVSGFAMLATPRFLDLPVLVLLWSVTLIGIMTPAVAPMILLYARVARQSAAKGRPLAATSWFTGGYLLCWIGFALTMSVLQIWLQRQTLQPAEADSTSRLFSGFVLLAAGLFQWGPLKDACLSDSHTPQHFIQRHGGFKSQASQSLRLGAYLAKQKIKRVEKFPLLVELEPLFACNLKCAGCGKIEQPHDVLKKRMPVEQAVAAVLESGAPMVSIAGGEPLMHKQIDEIVRQLLDRNKIVFLCTNAVLLPKHIDKFKPHRNFAWMVHIDGLRDRHDESVRKIGVFDQAVAAIKEAKARGFRVMTNTTFFDTDTPNDVIELLDYLNDDLGVDNMQISPGYAYERAPDQEHWLGTEQTRALFKAAFGEGRRKKWRLNHSPLFLDFLEGKREFECTPWGIPSYSLLGWQRPCYLLDDGYAETYKELIETTDWDAYGRGRDPRCSNCMAHCGYEPTAVLATMGSLRETIRAAGVMA